jgi:predicted phosphodiesterase
VARIKITYKTTRVVIFGDLHANWEAFLILQQVERHPYAVLCLGDIVGYGPDAKRCLDAVRANATHVIGGRHDWAVGERPEASAQGDLVTDDLLAATWDHTRSVLSADDLSYLASLPQERTVEVVGTRFHLTRLAPDDLETESHTLVTMSEARLQELYGDIDAEVILVGGPHVPAMRQLGEQLIICPGSLGQPRYGVPEPTFAVWHNGRVQIHHLHYQPRETIRKLSLLPLDPEHARHLQSILRTGGLE